MFLGILYKAPIAMLSISINTMRKLMTKIPLFRCECLLSIMIMSWMALETYGTFYGAKQGWTR